MNVTADSVRNHNDPTDRLWEMVKHVHLYVVNLPLVVIRRNKNPTTFYIDDGAHRAVASYLAGFREAFAYIGVVRKEAEHPAKNGAEKLEGVLSILHQRPGTVELERNRPGQASGNDSGPVFGYERQDMAHVHGGSVTGRYIGLSIVLTILFVAGETVAGYWSNSLALLSDAGHNFADALALIFSWYALRAGRWPADAKRTFGYHRVGILAALVNAVSLVLIALFIFWEAIHRLRSPESVQGGLMIGVALAAVLLNGLISVWLHAEGKHDLNIRSAYLHMLGDALSAVGVVIAGIIVIATGQNIADPLVSLLIGAFILWSSWGVLTEAVSVLMEAVPKGLDLAKVVESIRQVQGVLDVHDLHVWTVASGVAACCLHVRVGEQSALEGQRIQQAVADMLEHDFRITHSTIQVEVEGCGVNDLHCDMRATAQHEPSDHAHQ